MQLCSAFASVQVWEKADSPVQLDWGFFLRQVEHLRIWGRQLALGVRVVASPLGHRLRPLLSLPLDTH